MLQRINFGRLAKEVLAKGHTTKGLGERIGLSQPAVSRLASGRTRALSADVAIHLIYMAGGSVHLPDEHQAAQTRETQRPEAAGQ